MINQGSAMALCLKYVTNKIPSATPLVLMRTRVSSCTRQLLKHSLRSPSSPEFFGHCGFSPLYPASYVQTFQDLVPNESNVSKLKCESDVIKHISDLIFHHIESWHTCNTEVQKLLVSPLQCNTYSHACQGCGMQDVVKQRGICDTQISRSNEETSCLLSTKTDNALPYSHQEGSNTKTKNENLDPFQPPSEEQLNLVLKTLAENLPRFFAQTLDLRIYHPNIVFEDNFRGKRFSGLVDYNLQSKLFYIVSHIRFMYIKLDVLKITAHPEDGTVKVRWKISILRLRKIPWRLKLWNFSSSLQDAKETWLDGFSTYYVKGDGLVHKHVADKMIPDSDQLLKKQEPKTVPVANPIAYSDRNKI